ncbi:MAG TPA: AbiEi antitoxin N-terminal domain-containing protein, partial [Bdellovibrionota bacterium]|nr:AbiEi antitoxin N-terminal domain-containing protein [Bdellovibrionota bacterium]
MNTSKESKLNRLVTSVASGTCNATAYFAEQGYSYRLLHNYEESGWLEFLERGAFIRKGDQVDWFGGLYAIQKQLKKKIHVGGKTALLLQGYGQSVPLGKEQVHLFGPSNETLPKWFTVHKWGADI